MNAQLLNLMLALSNTGLAGGSSALDVQLEQLKQERWQASLEATDYAPSPYQSPDQLPAILEVETYYQGFNDYYYFALVDGHVYFKPRFKRPAGERDWVTELQWRPFGMNGGLPYRLDHRRPETQDTTYADGDRSGFIPSMAYVQASQDQWPQYIDAQGWSRAGEWLDTPIAFDQDFPSVSRVVALTADDDEIAVLSDTRQMFYRRKFANIFVSTEWYYGWGQAKELPVFFPAHLTDNRGWSLGRITADGVGYKEGPDGRIFEWGPAAVSMETMVWLSPDGRKIYYLDSGTPPEVAHYVEAPFRGQYQGQGINSSASTVMLIDRFGAVQTKIADFDLLGSTPTHPYCYFEECDSQPYYPAGDIRSGMSDIRLPGEGWMQHSPVLPAERWSADTWLTSRITLIQNGKGNAARELRIVGSLDGELGYFYKNLLESEWRFRSATPGDMGFVVDPDERLRAEELSLWRPGADLAALHTAEPALDHRMVGQIALDRDVVIDLVVDDFNMEASPWQAHLRWADVDLPVEMHVVQAWSPYMSPHSADPDSEIHTFECTLAFDRQALEQAMAGGEASSTQGMSVRHLLDDTKNAKFGLVVNATHQGFEIRPKRRRRMGRGFAIALRPELAKTQDIGGMMQTFWELQRHHMGWEEELSALEQSQSCDVQWAAQVVELEERVGSQVTELRKLWREARRFSRTIFLTSGFLYVSQAQTLNAAMDNRREWRGGDVRPNELRFNVITGVSTRIPYLAGNIGKVQRARHHFAKLEAEEIHERLKAARERAEECAE